MFQIDRLVCDPVIPLNIDYLPVEYYFDNGFHYLISSRDDCDPNMIIHLEFVDIHTNAWKLDSGVGSEVWWQTGPEHFPPTGGLL